MKSKEFNLNEESQSSFSKQTEGEVQEAIAEEETYLVTRLRLLVLGVLIACALTTALLVYFYTTDSEEDKFEDKFTDDANKVMESLGSTLEKTLGAFDSMAVNVVIAAKALNQTWPFVNIPNFALQVSKLLPLSGALYMTLNPLVRPDERLRYEQHTMENHEWLNYTVQLQESWDHYYGPTGVTWEAYGVIHGDYGDMPYNLTRNYLPTWQNFPAIIQGYPPFNWDWLAISYPEALYRTLDNHKAVLSEALLVPDVSKPDQVSDYEIWSEWYGMFLPPERESFEPLSDVYYPIIDEVDKVNIAGSDDYIPSEHKLVGVLGSSIYWRSMLVDVLPPGSSVLAVFKNDCSLPFTFEINGPLVEYLGPGDLHDKSYDSWVVQSELKDLNSFSVRSSQYTGAPLEDTTCQFTIYLYPTEKMKDEYVTSNPKIFAVVAVMIFLFTSLVFVVYDCVVERRQKKVLSTAVRTNAIVSSLFPSAVRDRIYPKEDTVMTKNKANVFRAATAKSQLQSFLGDSKISDIYENCSTDLSGAPIAELYPETTIFFADIAGFTAWSSERSPENVFHLLETLYASFDKIAKHRGVFKVETIGDSYVAVVGLPTPRQNHAIIMARFAMDCLEQMEKVTPELERTLGPGTTDLKLRVGLNSGPTTAGVLRGEKGRFQLFGDTVNTASRMESNGSPSRIHVSQKTADLLVAAGKEHWLIPREDKIHAKGKGQMQTYWCNPKSGPASSFGGSTIGAEDEDLVAGSLEERVICEKRERLVDWHAENFEAYLRKLVASRNKSDVNMIAPTAKQRPNFDPKSVILHSLVTVQLRQFINTVAENYPNTPFHNFDHASHVTMSTEKLLDLLEAHEKESIDSENTSEDSATFSIVSDELAKFAIIFSALIHDIEHKGVNDNTTSYVVNDSQNVAQKSSVDVAWGILMQQEYNDLCQCMFETEEEKARFHHLVLNILSSTDVFRQELSSLRHAKWQMKTNNRNGQPDIPVVTPNKDAHKRANEIVKLIIQAADISHTMRYFTIYKKWNLQLLKEMYLAYKYGSYTNDPLESWYEAEICFFDSYVIPVAKKLQECGAFGFSCDEFLNYALDNRQEWKSFGKEIIEDAKELFLLSSEEKGIRFAEI